MHETVSPQAHGLIDYVAVVAFALAPTLFQFDGVPALIAYGLAGVHLVLTLATRFPMGLFVGIPLRAHGVVELVVSVGLIILPWVAGFVQPGAQWFFPVMGMLVFVVWLLSDYGQLKPVGEPPAERSLEAPPGSGPAEDAGSLAPGAPPGTRVPEKDAGEEGGPETHGPDRDGRDEPSTGNDGSDAEEAGGDEVEGDEASGDRLG